MYYTIIDHLKYSAILRTAAQVQGGREADNMV